MNVDQVIKRIVKTMRIRYEREGKRYGVIVRGRRIGRISADGVSERYSARRAPAYFGVAGEFESAVCPTGVGGIQKQTGQERRVIGLQLGYEARCAKPHAFDVMLGSQLGVGAYRALVEQRLDGVMVSVEGQLKLIYRKFEDLVDPQSLVTHTRFIDLDSDFHKLARFLETDVDE